MLLTPKEYVEAIKRRVKKFAEMQAAIKKAGLSGEQEKMLHVAIQGYFREWLVTNNYFKPIADLVRMIDQEY